MFCSNGDEQIAPFDVAGNTYYYGGGALRFVAGTGVYTLANGGMFESYKVAANPTLAYDHVGIYRKGDKLVLTCNVAGTQRYVTIDFSGNGNAITTTGTTAP